MQPMVQRTLLLSLIVFTTPMALFADLPENVIAVDITATAGNNDRMSWANA